MNSALCLYGRQTGSNLHLRRVEMDLNARPYLPEEAESLLLYWGRGLAANGPGHLPDRLGDLRIILHERDSRVLHAAHGCIVVGDLPIRGPGESLGNMLFGDLQAARIVPVQYDFQFRASSYGEPCNQAIGVAQFGDADLHHHKDGGGFVEDARALQVEFRSGIDHHIIEVLASDLEQLVDGVIGDVGGSQFTGRRKHE